MPEVEIIRWFCSNARAVKRTIMTCIDIWTVDLRKAANACNKVLDKCDTVERARAARIYDETRRARFICSHAALRQILTQYLKVSVDEVVLSRDSRGKPYINGREDKKPLFFNLSHAGVYAMCALSRDDEVGVDVERVRPLGSLECMSRRVCSDNEREMMNNMPLEDRLEWFFRVWTHKEAVAKCVGDGLSMGLKRINVGSVPAASVVVHANHREVMLHDIPVESGYYAAVAVRYHPGESQVRRYTFLI